VVTPSDHEPVIAPLFPLVVAPDSPVGIETLQVAVPVAEVTVIMFDSGDSLLPLAVALASIRSFAASVIPVTVQLHVPPACTVVVPTDVYEPDPTLRYIVMVVPVASVLVPETVVLLVVIALPIAGAVDTAGANVNPEVIFDSVVGGKLLTAVVKAAKKFPL